MKIERSNLQKRLPAASTTTSPLYWHSTWVSRLYYSTSAPQILEFYIVNQLRAENEMTTLLNILAIVYTG